MMARGTSRVGRHIRDDEFVELVRQHQPISPTELSKIIGNSPSCCMYRLGALAVLGVLEKRSSIEVTPGSRQKRKVIRYRIADGAAALALADRHDVAWRPAVWVHPIRRAMLENRALR